MKGVISEPFQTSKKDRGDKSNLSKGRSKEEEGIRVGDCDTVKSSMLPAVL